MEISSGNHCSHVDRLHEGNPLAERNTRRAVVVTVIMMIVEITGGWLFNSMALLADGWHMSSHALALGLSAAAYAAARRYARDHRFNYGTWKIEILGGYTSALFLLLVAALMVYHSVERLLEPAPIHYNEAIGIAALGLLVNLVCAWLLRGGHGHGHGHAHDQDHPHDHDQDDRSGHSHQDLNLRSAYVHVIADAATSVLAIVALCGGKLWGAAWLDPVVGIGGAALVAIWAVGLIRDTARVLLDAEMDAPVVREIREVIGSLPFGVEITDLHVSRVATGKYSCVLSVSSDQPVSPDYLRQQLSVHEELAHITVEVNQRAPTVP